MMSLSRDLQDDIINAFACNTTSRYLDDICKHK